MRGISGNVTVELTSADPVDLLQKLSAVGIPLWDVGEISGLEVCTTLPRDKLSLLRKLCHGNGASVRVIRSAGLMYILRQLLKRPVLILSGLLIGILTLYLPTHIFFIEVEGATDLPAGVILANAEECGLKVGTNRKSLRSEKVKNALLEKMPQLQWVGVNTYGCRAVISVRQRTLIPEEDSQTGISSLVAMRDGVIREMTILKGYPLCSVGQSVVEGQVLVSGYTDLGICIRGTCAEGEIFAETRRSMRVVTLSQSQIRGDLTGVSKKYSLLFGKKRINFFKGSGISFTSCDKMYVYHYVTLPGGFQLPVALVVENTLHYHVEQTKIDESDAAELLSMCAEEYLQQSMAAGSISHRYEIVTELDGIFYQTGKYACYEMIGMPRPEEDLGKHETD